jgi:alpha,alpha-trehalase
LTTHDTGPLDVQGDAFGMSDALSEFSPYPAIADYAFLSDCEVNALVAPGGSIEWMCLPRLDCPSVFGAVIDRDAGWFRVGPEDMTVPADRRCSRPAGTAARAGWWSGTAW